ncbi:hypothetical protein [Steroidobacter denitrificans]|uniref:hypothetical protein n=1 Tax=Steroidobacter denitrificans TaxID=465721 RepID=UPI0012EED863|nr:hypothetical protein [Steroidobacter denitrificans]
MRRSEPALCDGHSEPVPEFANLLVDEPVRRHHPSAPVDPEKKANKQTLTPSVMNLFLRMFSEKSKRTSRAASRRLSAASSRKYPEGIQESSKIISSRITWKVA